MMSDQQFDFEKLEVYQKSLNLIDHIFILYKKWSYDYKISIGSNLIRAAMSIANNLAEGNGKRSNKEKRRYFGIALDSARECVSVFNILKRQQIINLDYYYKIRSETKEITNMIWALINSLI